MTKERVRPTFSASRRRIVAAAEWKVATLRSEAQGPSRTSRRSRISRAALFVKVTARIRHGGTRRARTRCATRRVMTRVFPDPAPARTRSGPSPWRTASRWGGFRSSRSWSADWSGDGPDIGAGHPRIPSPRIQDGGSAGRPPRARSGRLAAAVRRDPREERREESRALGLGAAAALIWRHTAEDFLHVTATSAVGRLAAGAAGHSGAHASVLSE